MSVPISLAVATATETSTSSTGIAVALVASAALIVLNGIFVAYEFAVVAARRSSFAEGGPRDGRVAAAARSSLADLSMQLAGAQLGITIASLALGRIGDPALEALLEGVLHRNVSEQAARWIGFSVALGVLTFLHLIFGEMVPKNLALAAPEATLRWLVLPYRLYLLLFRPVIAALNWLANLGCRMVGIVPRDELMSVHTPSELSAIVTHSSLGGAIEADDAELLKGVLQFAERPVGEIATPIAEHPSVVLGATGAQVERAVAASGAARITVMATGGAEPVGYLHARDLLAISPEDHAKPVRAEFVRQMAVIPADTLLFEVLRILRRLGRQLALVRSADGGLGIVSVDQVVEALIESGSSTAAEQRHQAPIA